MLNNQKSDASVIQVFNSPQFGEIRTAGTSEEPLFCLSDVCSVLGLRQGDVKQRLDDGVVSTQPIIDALGREQQANFVNEDGLYDVILDSRKPQAKAFRKWVTSEVLPAIRKTGGYIATKSDDTPEEIMARALTIAQATKKYLFLFGDLYNCCTFAVSQFYYHIRIGDFLCPILKYCLKYKQRFLRTYSPQSRYGTVTSWRNSLLSLFINF